MKNVISLQKLQSLKYFKQHYAETLENLNEKDKALKTQLSKLSQNEIDNQNSSISVKVIKFVIKNPISMKALEAEICISKFVGDLRKKIYQFYKTPFRKQTRQDISQLTI